MAYPGALAVFAGFTATHTLAADNHAAQHNLEQAEILAVQTKVGIGASTPTAGKVLAGDGVGTSSWSQVNLTTMVSGVLPVANGGTGQITLSGLPLPSPVISGNVTGGATYVSPILTTPTIADYTSATHTHASNSQGGQLNGANAIIDGTITPNELIASSGTSWVWQNWIPTPTNVSVGDGTLVGKYTQIGKTTIARLSLVFGSTTSVSGDIMFSLPVASASYAASATIINVGMANMFDTSASRINQAEVSLASATTMVFRPMAADLTYVYRVLASSTVPFTWAIGDELGATIIYEAG